MNRPRGNYYTLPGSEAQCGTVGQLDLQPALHHQKELIRPGMLVPGIVAGQYAQSETACVHLAEDLVPVFFSHRSRLGREIHHYEWSVAYRLASVGFCRWG